MVRHSSGAIIHCLCMSRIGASSTVAEEAALGRTFETERGEIRAMSAQLEAQRAEAARLISDADHMSIRMPIPMDSLVLEAPAVVSATSVRTSRAVWGNGQCYAHRRLPIPSARTFCALETPLPKEGCLPAALLSPTKPSVAGPCCRLPERACSGWSPMTPPPEIGNGVHTAHAFVRHVNSKPTTGRTPWMPRATGLVLRALVRLARIDAQAGGLR